MHLSHIVAALAYIGEKSRGILSSRGIFNSLQSQENFSPFLLISWDSVRFVQPHPLHEKFSPSRGIYRLKLLIKIIFPLYFQEIKFLLGSRHFHIPREVLPISPHLVGFILSRPHPLHEKFSPSRGIYRLKLLIEIIFPL